MTALRDIAVAREAQRNDVRKVIVKIHYVCIFQHLTLVSVTLFLM